MKKQVTVLFLLLTLIVMQTEAQHSFEKIVRSPNDDRLYSTIENFNHQFISLGSRSITPTSEGYCPLVIKLDTDGNLLEEKLYCKTDTSASFKFGIQKSNGNYLIMGTMKLMGISDSRLPLGLLFLCELDMNLNVVSEKVHEIPEPYVRHSIFNWFVALDGTIIIQSSAHEDFINYSYDLLLINIDMDGNLLKMEAPENLRSYGKGDFLEKADGTGFYMVGDMLLQSIHKDWMEFDYNFNLISYGQVEGSGYLFPPLSNKRLPDGNVFLANHSISYGNYNLGILKLGNDFDILKDTILEYDQPAQLPLYNGLDFTIADNIYICSYRHLSLNTIGTSDFYIHIFDAEMNLKGTKVCGGDTHYTLYSLLATSDSGCIITGVVPDYETSYLTDSYVLKLMPEDILTAIEEQPDNGIAKTSIYPNPFTTDIFIKTKLNNCQFLLFDAQGRLLITERNICSGKHHISTSHLPPGIYFYFFENDNQADEYGKLVKF